MYELPNAKYFRQLDQILSDFKQSRIPVWTAAKVVPQINELQTPLLRFNHTAVCPISLEHRNACCLSLPNVRVWPRRNILKIGYCLFDQGAMQRLGNMRVRAEFSSYQPKVPKTQGSIHASLSHNINLPPIEGLTETVLQPVIVRGHFADKCKKPPNLAALNY